MSARSCADSTRQHATHTAESRAGVAAVAATTLQLGMHLEFVQFCMANDRWSGSSLALRSERPLASHLRQSGPSESSLADKEEAVRVGVRLFRRGPDLCAGSCLQRTWKKRSSRRRRSWRMTLCCNFDTFNDSVWRLEWFLSCLSTCQGDFLQRL